MVVMSIEAFERREEIWRLRAKLAAAEGLQPRTLGKRILRTETAGMTVLSVLMYLLEGRTERENGSISG